jgi:coatomer subunit beta'
MSGLFSLAERCFENSSDYNSQLLFYSSCGDLDALTRVAANAEQNGKYNVAFQASYLIGDADRCVQILIKSKRIAEAAFFARAYCPSQISAVVKDWDDSLKAKKLPFEPEIITSPNHS